MIDFTIEEPIPITSASSHIPTRPALSTTWRYVLKGVRGRKLESGMIGGRRYTTRQAIARFVAPKEEEMPPITVSRSQRHRQSEAAVKALVDRGL